MLRSPAALVFRNKHVLCIMNDHCGQIVKPSRVKLYVLEWDLARFQEWDLFGFECTIRFLFQFWAIYREMDTLGLILRKFWKFLCFFTITKFAISRISFFREISRDLINLRYTVCSPWNSEPCRKKTEWIGPLLRKLELFLRFLRWYHCSAILNRNFFKIDRRWDIILEMSHERYPDEILFRS